MKLKTSFFNPTVFKKNLTRFAPSWILYSLCLLMGLLGILDGNTDYVRSLNAADSIQLMAAANFAYALLNAQLLFGDMYNSRLCNALHAMPLRRECWFCTNAASGLTFAAVPNVVFSLVLLPILGQGWSVALWWLLAVQLQYLFFFGAAVFSAFLAGSRFAQVLVYGLFNFLSILCYWFAAALFEPLMYGVSVDVMPFVRWCPVAEIAGRTSGFVDIELIENGAGINFGAIVQIQLTGNWGYLVLCAVIGMVLLGVGLLIYRKRNLETAGDFIAVKAVEPVFLVLFTLAVGAFFQLCGRVFDSGLEYFFLALGLVVGYFAGRMLLKRTLRVFQPKAFLGLGGIAAGVVLCLVLVIVDAFGIVHYVPEAEDVESIVLQGNLYRSMGDFELTEDEDIAAFLEIHRYAINNKPEGWTGWNSYSGCIDDVYYTTLYLDYQLKDGSTLERIYSIPVESEAGQVLKKYYTSVEYVLGVQEDGLQELADRIYSVYIDQKFYDADTLPALFEGDAMYDLLCAVAADCEAGNMVQSWSYHQDESSQVCIELDVNLGREEFFWVGFYVFDSCENTLNWLDSHGFDIEGAMYGG